MKLFDRHAWVGLLACLLLGGAFAHEGHDHGAEMQALTGTFAPRFEARSDLFEVVGVLQGSELVIYLDRASDNEPLRKGEIEIDAGNEQTKASADASGVFRLKAGKLAQPGKHSLTLTITAGDDGDLLTATFEHGTAAHPAATLPPSGINATSLIALLGLLALVLLLVLTWHLRKRKSS